MNVSMEQIDEMRKRTNCSYQEAKELLEKNNGDMIEAIIEFEKKHGYKSTHKHCKHDHKHDHKHGEKIKSLFQKGFITRFVIEKGENTVLNIPVNILILAVLLTLPMIWIYPFAFIAVYLMGYKIRIRKEEGQDVDINEFMDGIGSKVRNAADKMNEKPADKEQKDVKSEVKKDDDVNEITVE